MRAGLCSVTLRAHTPQQVLDAARDAGLRAIEWGTDVHAPIGDVPGLARLAALTADAGLAVAALGSYLVLGDDDPAARAATVAAAVALGAPRIRVWAGRTASADAGPDHRAGVARAAADLTTRAADAGVRVGLEFHGGTLTDTTASTLDLLADVGHPMLGTYWQPPLDAPTGDALAGLDAVLPHLLAVHAFSWWPATERHPLESRADLWGAVAARLSAAGADVDVLLEFVPGDDPAGVRRDAATLHGLLAARRP